MRDATDGGTIKPTARAIKLAAEKRALLNNPTRRTAIEYVERHAGNNLAEAILLNEIDVSTAQLYILEKYSPADIQRLAPLILECGSYQAALRKQQENTQLPQEDPQDIEAKLRAALKIRIATLIEDWGRARGEQWTPTAKPELFAMVDKASFAELKNLINFELKSARDLERIDDSVIRELIEGHDKHKLGSIADMLARRREREKSEKPPPRKEALEAIEQIIAVIGEDSYRDVLRGRPTRDLLLEDFNERDLIDWAFPVSELRTRQIWKQLPSYLRDLRATIKWVDKHRVTALNIFDIATWKGPMAGSEEFRFKSGGVLFTISIEKALTAKYDRAHFPPIEKAIQDYEQRDKSALLVKAVKDAAFADDDELKRQLAELEI